MRGINRCLRPIDGHCFGRMGQKEVRKGNQRDDNTIEGSINHNLASKFALRL